MLSSYKCFIYSFISVGPSIWRIQDLHNFPLDVHWSQQDGLKKKKAAQQNSRLFITDLRDCFTAPGSLFSLHKKTAISSRYCDHDHHGDLVTLQIIEHLAKTNSNSCDMVRWGALAWEANHGLGNYAPGILLCRKWRWECIESKWGNSAAAQVKCQA